MLGAARLFGTCLPLPAAALSPGRAVRQADHHLRTQTTCAADSPELCVRAFSPWLPLLHIAPLSPKQTHPGPGKRPSPNPKLSRGRAWREPGGEGAPEKRPWPQHLCPRRLITRCRRCRCREGRGCQAASPGAPGMPAAHRNRPRARSPRSPPPWDRPRPHRVPTVLRDPPGVCGVPPPQAAPRDVLHGQGEVSHPTCQAPEHGQQWLRALLYPFWP